MTSINHDVGICQSIRTHLIGAWSYSSSQISFYLDQHVYYFIYVWFTLFNFLNLPVFEYMKWIYRKWIYSCNINQYLDFITSVKSYLGHINLFDWKKLIYEEAIRLSKNDSTFENRFTGKELHARSEFWSKSPQTLVTKTSSFDV